jgi:YesN/AraC family two-component response regulator
MKTKILIVDDHALFRDGLKMLINHESEIEVVGDAENGEVAI